MAAYPSASAAQLLLQTHCLSSHQSLHGGTGTFCTLVARSDINKAHSVPTMVLYILQIQNDCCLINYCISLKFRHITEIIKWKSSKQKFFSFLLRAPRARQITTTPFSQTAYLNPRRSHPGRIRAARRACVTTISAKHFLELNVTFRTLLSDY